MKFSLGFLRSPSQVVIRTADSVTKEIEETMVDLEMIKTNSLQGILYLRTEADSDYANAVDFILGEGAFFPSQSFTASEMNEDAFHSTSYNSLLSLYQNLNTKWTLASNLRVVEELFLQANHFKELFEVGRQEFFSELWFFLKRNMGASYLKIVYNDLIQGAELTVTDDEGEAPVKTKSNIRPKLGQFFVAGNRLPEIHQGKDLEKELMFSYEKNFLHSFEIASYDEIKKQLVMTATMKKTPILIMAEVYSLTPLTRSLLKSFFQGINL